MSSILEKVDTFTEVIETINENLSKKIRVRTDCLLA